MLKDGKYPQHSSLEVVEKDVEKMWLDWGRIHLPPEGGRVLLQPTKDFYGIQYMEYVIGMWPFDEGTGTTTEDKSDNDNHGALENEPSWTEGINGNALEFDGVNDYVSIPGGTWDDFDETDSYTLECWFKTTTTNGGQIISRRHPGNDDATYIFMDYEGLLVPPVHFHIAP